MKHLITSIIASLLLCVGLAACGGDRDAERQFDRADALIDSAPDAALMLLDSMCADSLGGGQRARYGLLYTKAATKNRTPLADDSLIGMAVDYYSGRGDSLEIQSLFYQGYHYSNNGVADSALLLLSRAYEMAVPAHDLFYAAMSSREMAAVYRRLFMIGEGLKWAREAKQLFTEAEKPAHAAWMDHNIVNAMIFSGDFNGAKELLDSIGHSDFYSDVAFRRHVILNRVELALQLKSYHEIDSLYYVLESDQYMFRAHDRLNQAKAALASGKYDDADRYLSMARQLDMSDADSLFSGSILSRLAAAQGDYKTAYEQSRVFAEDLMNSDVRLLSNPQTMLLTDNYKLKAENHRLQVARSREFIIGLIVICLLLGALIVFLRKNYKSRLMRERLEVEKLVAESHTLHDDLTLSNRRYNELSEEGQVMKRAMADMETEFANEVRGLFSRHLDLLNRMCEIWYRNRDTSSRGNHIYKEITSMLGKMSHIKVAEELAEIINRHDNNWVDRFRKAYPGLGEAEYQLALYLYMGFRPSTIAVLADRENTQAVHIAKYKLKKKLTESGSAEAQSLVAKLWE